MPEMRFLIEDILEQKIVDGQNVVRNEDAKEMADRLRKEEGLLCGISSGANVFAAIQLTKIMQKGSRQVTVLVDRRDRFFAEYPDEHYVGQVGNDGT
jgi:cysteine synthase A